MQPGLAGANGAHVLSVHSDRFTTVLPLTTSGMKCT